MTSVNVIVPFDQVKIFQNPLHNTSLARWSGLDLTSTSVALHKCQIYFDTLISLLSPSAIGG